MGSFFKKLGGLSLGGAGALGVLGGGGSDPGKKQQKGILAAHNQQAMQNRSLFAQAAYQQRQGLGAINQGYKQAESALGTGAANARQTIADRETRNLGELKAGVAANGMSGTSTANNLQRAVYSDSTRQLANVDAELGALKAELAQRRAGAIAGQYGQLAGIAQNQAGASNALGQNLINSLGNVQYESPSAWLQSLLGIGGTALGYSLGGPAGGAVGGQVGNAIGGGGQQTTGIF